MAASSSSSTPHFFKVIIPQTLTQQKLDVPTKFVRNYGERLEGEEVCLKVEKGAVWKIGLKKSDKKIWLEKGWDEFVKFYSIDHGHFLVFKYEGNSCFHVLIFDKTATEIDYPAREFKNKTKSENEDIKGFKMKVKMEIGEEFEENIQILPSSPTLKRRSHDQASGSKAICKSHELNIDLKPKVGRNRVKSSLKEKEAFKFKSLTKNPSFFITLGHSYLHTGRGNVCIPSSFGNNCLRGIDELTLQVSNEKVWKVKCIERRHSNNTKRFEMRYGWKIFAKDNKLKEGDVCVFELIKNTKVSFNVTIF